MDALANEGICILVIAPAIRSIPALYIQPIDDPVPVPRSPIEGIVHTVTIIHAPHSQVVVPEDFRSAISIDIYQE